MSRHFSFTSALDKEISAIITDKIEFLDQQILGTPALDTSVNMQWDGDDGSDIFVGTRGRHRESFSFGSKVVIGDTIALIRSAREADRSSARVHALEWLEEFA
jgi:hypothetical protein